MKINNATKLISILFLGLSMLLGSSSAAYASAPSNKSYNTTAIALSALGVLGAVGAGFAIFGNNSSSSNPAPAPAPSSSDKAITAYSLNVEGATTEINGQTITVTVPRSTDLTSQPFIATFTTTGTSVAVGSAVQTSGVTPVTFPSDTYSLTYTVTAADGSTVDYTVNVAAKLYTVTYDANGGNGSIPSVSYVSGTEITLPNGDNFTRDNYTFLGWDINPNNVTPLYSEYESYIVAQDVILYAIWSSSI